MYCRDHPPSHFHAAYAGHVAQIDIETLEIIDGWLATRALRLVAEWGGEHRDERRENWDRARAHQRLFAIDPLPWEAGVKLTRRLIHRHLVGAKHPMLKALLDSGYLTTSRRTQAS